MRSDHRVLLCCFVAWFCCAVVKCHVDLLDAGENPLKGGNRTDEDRPEIAVIKVTNIHEAVLVKSHPGVILSDTRYKDATKISDEVCDSHFPKCTDTGGNCIENEQSATQCVCPGKSLYEADKGCTVSDEVCKTDFPKCMDTGGKCNVEVGSVKDQSVVQCECPEVSGYIEGTGCKECDCGNESYGCMFEKGEKKCDCYEKYGQKDGVCTECNCGNESISCNFEKGEKICRCRIGYGHKDGVCTVCACGDHSLTCSFQGDNKTCICLKDYAQKEDQCVDCACGDYSRGCIFQGDNKSCDCYLKTFQRDDKCEDCACGYAHGCSFDRDTKTKICDCYRSLAQKGDQCEECNCGSKTAAASCHFDNDEKKCECNEGFMVINGECKTLADECEETCGHDESVTCERKGNQTLCLCDEGKTFDSLMRKCRNECEEACGLGKDVTCEHKEDSILCLCDEGKSFDPILRMCINLYKGGLSGSDIAAIVVSISVGIFILASLYYLKCVKKSQFNRRVPDHGISSGVSMKFQEGTRNSP